MNLIVGLLVGFCIGEALYLLDARLLLSGGSTPAIIQYIYGMFVITPVKLSVKLSVTPHIATLFYYGLNGLLAGTLMAFMKKNRKLGLIYFGSFFLGEILLGLVFL